MLLDGKRAFITGAGRGIGRAIATAFAREGCDCALAARTESELEEAANDVRAAGRRAETVVCDVADPDSVGRAAQHTLKALGPVDILVNNAGYACFQPVSELSLDEWRRQLDVNLTGPFLVAKAFLPAMMERRSGRIINVSSVAGLKPIKNQSGYCASKHGLNGFSKTLAMEVRDYGIAVHSVCPGAVETRLSTQAMPDRDPSAFMHVDDVAHVCLFLATQSERAVSDEVVVRRFGSVPLGG